jgi:hypothetical protein
MPRFRAPRQPAEAFRAISQWNLPGAGRDPIPAEMDLFKAYLC